MIKALNNSIRFLLELISIGLIITIALKVDPLILKIIFSFGFPICTILFWSNYMAPLAPKRFNNMQRIITEIILFGGIGFLTYFIGDQKIALIYLIMITFNTIFDHIL